MQPCEILQGDSPLILGFPHVGTFVPSDINTRLNDRGKVLADTDWHVDRLYADLLPNVTMVRANFHRYVIDANRNPSDETLYPGQNTTGLCPTTDFDGDPIYLSGKEPSKEEIEDRRIAWHAPYHAALADEIERIKAIHGIAILYDCHSIRSLIPFLFEGRLPDFNVGTNMGATCDASIEQAVFGRTKAATGYQAVLNGRFKGGWTTRHYGRPDQGVHAIQMELAQCTHLESETAPYSYDPRRAEPLRVHLKAILEDLSEIAKTLSKKEKIQQFQGGSHA